MAVQFQETSRTFSQTLSQVADTIETQEQVTLRELLMLIGEQGLLLFCMILVVPFLFPVSIPGVSTVFGAVIILIGIGVTLNRLPWLPEGLLKRTFETKGLVPTFRSGAQRFAFLDNLLRPRLSALSGNLLIDRLNGFMLTFAGVLLIFPLGLIPFSNTLPGIAVLLLAAGLLQRDGLMILLGYVFNLLTVIYFGALALGAIAAGQGIASLIGS
ncbi:MAG: exopolysaccharide biosynthesis protein [Anaerolineae bacterium]|nr:exopolysaccharide biosynthesis protein [Anaerolineae bacterium]MDW8171209.1 exopolysaccharide biosynthesis protein [Anaerolineae bacterium]